MRFFFLLCLFVMGFVGQVRAESNPGDGAEPGSASIQVCNDLPHDYELALAFEMNDEIITLGWYDLLGNSCSEDLAGAATFEGYDLRKATALWFHARDARLDPDESFGGEEEFCVDDFFDVFAVSFADSTCAKRGYVRAGFQAVIYVGPGTYNLDADGFR